MGADSLINISRPNGSYTCLYPISMGRYGPMVALPRISNTYRRINLKQSFFIPGWCLEIYPDTVEAILKDGHEIGHHGYLHEDPIKTAGRQQEWFERTLEVHQRVCGLRPSGYLAPVYNVTSEVIDLMVEHGLRYDTSIMADDIPYALETKTGKIYEIPVHWGTDFCPPFAYCDEIGYVILARAPSQGFIGFWEEFEAQYEAGDFFMLIIYPFLTGRLPRWAQVEKWIEQTQA